MDITVAYFHALLNPEVLKHDFEQIRSTGANSLVYAIHEQEEQRGPRDFERGLRLARDAGLKIHLSLGRFGNLFAGPALVPSWYTFRHPQSRVLDQHGRYHEISCFNHQSFRSWLFREIEHYLTTYPISGIVLDEPRGLEVTCYCPACRALCPDVTDLARFRRRSMIEFLRELCNHIKQIDAHARITIVLHPHDIGLAEDLAPLDDLDTIGCHLFWDMLQSDVRQVELWGRQVLEATRGTNRRSQLWLQNFNISERNAAAMEMAFAGLLSLEPDELGCFYFWRNNDDPLQVWETTCRLLKRVPRRQLHWRMYTSPSPAPRPMNITLPSRERLPGKLAVTPVTPAPESTTSIRVDADAPFAQPMTAPLLEMSPSEPAHADQQPVSTPTTPTPAASPSEPAGAENEPADLPTTPLPEAAPETPVPLADETTLSEPAPDQPGEPADS